MYVYLIISILLNIYMFYLLNHFYDSHPVNIEPSLLHSIYKIGTYEGNSTYSPTSIYKNGLYSNDKLQVSKTNNGITLICDIKVEDLKTRKPVYNGTKKIILTYKKNHGKKLFKIYKAYINGKLVSSQYGVAIGKTKNSITFNLSGAWYISPQYFNNIKNIVYRKENKLNESIVNEDLSGKGFTINSYFSQVDDLL